MKSFLFLKDFPTSKNRQFAQFFDNQIL